MKISEIVSKYKIRVHCSKSGTLYVYEDLPYWDKEKKQGRHKRNYIGLLDENENFSPYPEFSARQTEAAEGAVSKNNTDGKFIEIQVARRYFGAVHILNRIAETTGVARDLEICFGRIGKEILSLAYYLVLESDSPLYRFERWAYDHVHPHGRSISSQRISELIATLDNKQKMEFFRRQSACRQENEYLVYDTTSVSSYSELIKSVKYGKNKDGDDLPQINLALVVGELSGLPVYFRMLPGNISDVSTVRQMIKELDFLGKAKARLVMDRGFISAENIDTLYKSRERFLLGAKLNAKWLWPTLEKAKTVICEQQYYDKKHELQAFTAKETWVCESGLKRTVYIHIYFDEKRAAEEKSKFQKSLSEIEDLLLLGGKLSERQQKAATKYLIVKKFKNGVKIGYVQNKISEYVANCGYFSIVSNDIKDSSSALEIYRNKDVVEKAFDNLKERLEMDRTQVHSDRNLAGKLFLQFVALILLLSFRKIMSDNNLYKNYTLQSLINSMDIIEKYQLGNKTSYSEITLKQQKIFDIFECPIET